MSSRPIGYYVHHHGAGHLARARAIASASGGRVVLLGTGIGAQGIDLADDRLDTGAFDGADESDCRPGSLHYAPIDHEGIRSRVATIAQWIDMHRPALMVIDVSVEVAMLARLASVPIVYVRLNGDRTDGPHLEAFKGATALLAPFHRDIEAASTPSWVVEKTRYLPGVTPARTMTVNGVDPIILVVVGRGGKAGDGEALAQAARHCPQWRWRVIGPCSTPHDPPANLEILGWVEDADREIARATLVVGAAGDGLVSSVMAVDRPFVCIPQERPYAEQRMTAQRLGEIGAALVLDRWPEPERWSGHIMDALALPSRARRKLHVPDGARLAAQWLGSMADAVDPAQEKAA
ncbi:glycosyltransferase [Sphingobium sp. Leaf26]|uniref:glycosyl transferase n=1 Tax=Sphingobium sp. Leaf26 TaxID=1735693 RepID=UPI0006F1DEF6|nr:glycosyl transferase [Sphingobium sp. Leaf26]KQN08588.1 glycosyltransferase [Sphingobium sp. Leaf26]